MAQMKVGYALVSSKDQSIDRQLVEMKKAGAEKFFQKMLHDAIIQILSWTAQNERKEIKQKKRQGIANAKKKGHYKGRPVKYSATAKDLKDRMTYHVIVNKLKREEPIKKIAEDTGVTRDTVYRIKKEI